MVVDIQIIGLVYDVAGVAVLSVPTITNRVDDIVDQSSTHWDYNPPIVKSLSSARVDTITGFLLLLAGFIIQIISLCGYGATPARSFTLFVVLALGILLYYILLRPYWTTALSNQVKEQHKKNIEAENAA